MDLVLYWQLALEPLPPELRGEVVLRVIAELPRELREQVLARGVDALMAPAKVNGGARRVMMPEDDV